MTWAAQNAKGVGEMKLDAEQRKSVRKNQKSRIVFFDDEPELLELTRVFLQIPFEYGMMGAVGKKYEAIKDYLSWHGFILKKSVPVVEQMGMTWVAESRQK